MNRTRDEAPLRVSVIIVSWNAAPVLGRCLESLVGQRVTGGFETIVINNASTDHTVEVLREHADEVRVLTNDHNAGFSVGNNQGAKAARGRTLFFLNSDTELRAAVFHELGGFWPTLYSEEQGGACTSTRR